MRHLFWGALGEHTKSAPDARTKHLDHFRAAPLGVLDQLRLQLEDGDLADAEVVRRRVRARVVLFIEGGLKDRVYCGREVRKVAVFSPDEEGSDRSGRRDRGGLQELGC